MRPFSRSFTWSLPAQAALRQAVASGAERQQLRCSSGDWLQSGVDAAAGRKTMVELCLHKERRELVGVAYFGELAEGPPGLVHGGAISSVADICVAYLPYLLGKWGVTGSLTVNYVRPLPLLSTVHVTSRFLGEDSEDDRRMRLAFDMNHLEDDGVASMRTRPFATAEALIIIPKGGTANLGKSTIRH